MPVDLAAILAPKPSRAASLRTAVVTALLSGNRLQVNLDGVNVSVRRGLHFTSAVGDVVLVATTGLGEAWALMVIATGTSPTPIATPPGPPAGGTMTFPALDAASWRNGNRRLDRTNVMSGDEGGGMNNGAWFYGDSIAATLTGRTVTAAQVCIDRRGGNPLTAVDISLYFHNLLSAPTTGEPAAVVGWTTIGTVADETVAWLPLSVVSVQRIVDGTAAGVGIYQYGTSPFVVLASLAQSGQTGALSITWA